MGEKAKEVEKQEESIKTDSKTIDSEKFEKLEKEVEKLKSEKEEYVDSLKRNMAEFDNYKKRITKERDQLYVSTLSDVIQNILPVIDNFEKAVGADTKDKVYKNGIEMIYKDLMELLKKFEVETIPDIGETFNPEYHEAVTSVIDETKKEKEIVEVFRRGYKIKDRVIRHSLVKVAN